MIAACLLQSLADALRLRPLGEIVKRSFDWPSNVRRRLRFMQLERGLAQNVAAIENDRSMDRVLVLARCRARDEQAGAARLPPRNGQFGRIRRRTEKEIPGKRDYILGALSQRR